MFRTLKSWLTADTTGRTRPNPQLSLTALEAREVPATVTLAGGVLTVTGDNTPETITVYQNSAYLWVGGLPGVYPTSGVSKVVVDAKGGNDTVRLDTPGYVVSKPAHVFGGDGNDTIYGGSGNDYLDGQVGDDDLYGRDGRDQLVGDIGEDFMSGGAGDDDLAGGLGRDTMSGDGNVNRVEGGADADIVSVSGQDTLYGDQTGDTVAGFGSWTRRTGEHTTLGWFDANMNDGSTRRTARPTVLDGRVDRVEMIAVLKHVAHGADVSSTELNSLRNFAAAAPVYTPPHVRQLATNVTHGNYANRYWTGDDNVRGWLGDLAVGSTGAKLQKLIDKWFKGADLPVARSYDHATKFDYRTATGSLFVGEPTAADINQGDVGDCYFLAALGAVAGQDPQVIREMFIDNGDGTFTVRFFDDDRVPRYVTVDRRLPTDTSGRLVFAGEGDAASSPTTELWVALAEKAYCQMNESGEPDANGINWVDQDATNSYNGVKASDLVWKPDGSLNYNMGGLNSGDSFNVFPQITGRAATGITPASVTFDLLRAKFAAGDAIVFNTPDDPPLAGISGSHQYMMVGYESHTGRIKVRNPHGGDGAEFFLTITQVKDNFNSISAVALPRLI